MQGTHYYISDLHMSPESKAVNRLFDHFIEHHARDAASLTINGDFFNYYFGFKHLKEPFCRDVMLKLQSLVEGGTEVDFTTGNRDFLLYRDMHLFKGRGFKEEVTRSVGDTRVTAIHGDTFCLDDKEYLRFRKYVRAFPWRLINHVAPVGLGHMIAGGFRNASRKRRAQDSKPRSYYDIKDQAVIPFLREHESDVVVCGHIHQPQERHYHIAGKKRRMLVLSDWNADGAVIARCQAGGELELMRLTLDALEPWQGVVLEVSAPEVTTS